MWQKIDRWLFGERASAYLPDRVKQAIQAQQANAELLISWMLFSIVVVLGALYLVAPKPSDEVMFLPVPGTLAAYLSFAAIRILLVWRGFQPTWFLVVSVISDIVLLMALIWLFHLQYGQPASFYLKAPTMLYVFIFISLRALRFDPWFVILAGAAAAAGWLVLLGYAVTSEMWPEGRTRDFVEYVTSNKILLGAEFDKVITIIVTTFILAVAIVRARRLLIRSVVEQSARRDLSRFFSPAITKAITSSAHGIRPGGGELRRAAILHSDIRGFTALSKTMPPDDLIKLLTEYESRLVPTIQAEGGSIDKFLGDGILATFGAAVPSDTYAADAFRCVEKLVPLADAWNLARRRQGDAVIEIRFTVAVGDIVFGAIGDESRLEYTVVGEPVNTAVKLDKHAKVLGARVLTTAASLALAERQGYRPALTAVRHEGERVSGIDEPLDVVALGA